MTDQTIAELVEEARLWPRDGVNEGRLINSLADALEAAEKRAEENRKEIDRLSRELQVAEDQANTIAGDLAQAEWERDNWKLSAEEAERAEKRWKDRAEEAERERDSAMASYKDYMTLHRKAAELAAVVEKARLIVDRVPDGFWVDEVYELDNILNSVTAPDDALREVKAEAWQEGAYRVYNSTLDEAEWWWSDWASENPYKAREEQA